MLRDFFGFLKLMIVYRGFPGLLGFLVRKSVITERQAWQAWKKGKEEGVFPGYLLVPMGFVSEIELRKFMRKEVVGMPHLANNYDFSPEGLERSIQEFGREKLEEFFLRWYLLPIDLEVNSVTIAVADPLNSKALAAFKSALPGRAVRALWCDWELLRRIWGHYQLWQ